MEGHATLPVWVQWAQAIAVIVLPFIGATIAYEQMQIQRANLQNALYEKRYGVFNATRKFLSNVLTGGNVQEQDWRDFLIGTADAGFLFGPEIKEFIKELREHGSNVLVFGPYIEQNFKAGLALLSSSQHTQYVSIKTSAQTALVRALEELEDRFLPYMRLDKPTPIIGALAQIVDRKRRK